MEGHTEDMLVGKLSLGYFSFFVLFLAFFSYEPYQILVLTLSLAQLQFLILEASYR